MSGLTDALVGNAKKLSGVEPIPAFYILVVQAAGESFHTALTEAGWNVVHHTNDPLPWLEDLLNLMTVNAIVIAPSILYGPDDYGDDLAKCILMLPTYLALEDNVWLQLSSDEEVEGE